MDRMMAALTRETQRLQEKVGAKSNSIWHANKAELQELARKELGMTMAQSANETVVTLRERIRRARDLAKTCENPEFKLPPGLERMKLEDLILEAASRGLPGLPKPTRAALIVQIRDHVDALILLSQTTQSQNMSGPASSGQDTMENEDWVVANAADPSKKRR